VAAGLAFGPSMPDATIVEQRSAALDLANQIRIDRAKLRLRIGAGEVSATVVLEEFPACIGGAGVFQFLCYLPKTIGGKRSIDGRTGAKAFVLLRKANAPGHKRLDQLTPAQFERLTRVVREYEESKHPSERRLT
jgi:hypothetical protein